MGTAKIPTRSINFTDVIGTVVNRFNLHNMNYLYKKTMAIDATIRAGFTRTNEDHNKAEYKKCKACKSKTKCEITQTKISCIKCQTV